MSMDCAQNNKVAWKGREIIYDDWDNDRTGYLVFNASYVEWDGTATGLNRALIDYLDALPNENDLGWPKTTIEKLGLSGNLSKNGNSKELVVFPIRSYGDPL